MRHSRIISKIGIAALLWGMASRASFGDTAPGTATNLEGDNSKTNKLHDGSVSSSADQQSNDKAALETTRRIRKALTDNKTLSTYAQNVKIIWQNGEVLLKGPVRSATEKTTVEETATKMARGTPIKSELEVTPN